MRSDREKLLGLLDDALQEIPRYEVPQASDIADHLIANGVVVREWIPVTERLPDLELVEVKSNDTDLYPCLAVIKHERVMGGRYISKLWYDGIGFIDGDCVDMTSNVTHWMPLPEPPMRKGENG